MLETLDGAALRRWMRAAWRALGRERAEIDALNVFPVADSDTGTNLHLTVEAVVAGSGSDDTVGEDDAAAALAVLARAALRGARGNSGVILAQYLRGMAAALAAQPAPRGGPALAAALGSGADLAREAVAAPVAGTVLSVADAAADAARSACVAGVDDLATVAGSAAAAAHEALARTPSQLAVLAEAGVVDAGGRGLVLILDALVATVVDADLPDAPRTASPAVPADAEAIGHAAAVRPVPHDTGLGFEVMYALVTDDGAAADLRRRLDELGDSVVVSGGDGLWAVHVHLADAGAAIEAGLAVGTVSDVRVTALAAPAAPARAIVVVAPGDGLGALLTDAGAVVVRPGGAAPSATELVAAVRATGAGEVVLLPSDREGTLTAEAAARIAGGPMLRVRVVPSRSVVQSLAALAVHDPHRDLDGDVVAMTAAAVATRYGALTHAVRASLTTVGRCAPGDALGMVGDDVVTFGPDIAAVADDVVARLLAAGGELVTLVSGAGAAPGLVDGVQSRLRRTHPGLEVVVYDGGQPDHPLLVGVE